MKMSKNKFEYMNSKWLSKNKKFKIGENKYIYLYTPKQFLLSVYGVLEGILTIPLQIIIAVIEMVWEILICLPSCVKEMFTRIIRLSPILYIEIVEPVVKQHPKGQFYFDKSNNQH